MRDNFELKSVCHERVYKKQYSPPYLEFVSSEEFENKYFIHMIDYTKPALI